MSVQTERKTRNEAPTAPLDAMHHVAISVPDVREAVEWYTRNFRCEVRYQDETWALLAFANIQLALVIPDQHPPHISFTSPHAARLGPLKPHRDGTQSTYIQDPAGNPVEILLESNL
jgi:catechol 2,3-dioxygenase-like lactoylglutathione lyase family enzyme